MPGAARAPRRPAGAGRLAPGVVFLRCILADREARVVNAVARDRPGIVDEPGLRPRPAREERPRSERAPLGQRPDLRGRQRHGRGEIQMPGRGHLRVCNVPPLRPVDEPHLGRPVVGAHQRRPRRQIVARRQRLQRGVVRAGHVPEIREPPRLHALRIDHPPPHPLRQRERARERPRAALELGPGPALAIEAMGAHHALALAQQAERQPHREAVRARSERLAEVVPAEVGREDLAREGRALEAEPHRARLVRRVRIARPAVDAAAIGHLQRTLGRRVHERLVRGEQRGVRRQVDAAHVAHVLPQVEMQVNGGRRVAEHVRHLPDPLPARHILPHVHLHVGHVQVLVAGPVRAGQVHRVAAHLGDGPVRRRDRPVRARLAGGRADVLPLVPGARRTERHLPLPRLAVVVAPGIFIISLVALASGRARVPAVAPDLGVGERGPLLDGEAHPGRIDGFIGASLARAGRQIARGQVRDLVGGRGAGGEDDREERGARGGSARAHRGPPGAGAPPLSSGGGAPVPPT